MIVVVFTEPVTVALDASSVREPLDLKDLFVFDLFCFVFFKYFFVEQTN